MKQKFIKSILTLIAFVFLSSVMGQHRLAEPGKKQKSKTVKKEAPVAWEKSIKDIVFYEDFSGGGFDNWTVMGEGLDNWSATETNQAGGDIPEVEMNCNPNFYDTSRLVSPVINTSGYSYLSLSFLHVFDLWIGGGGFTVSVETTNDGGTTWNPVWEMYYVSNEDYYAFEGVAINTSDVGSENFQFCFKFEGFSDWLDWWRIDNITLGDPLLYDAGATAIMGFENLLYGGDDVMTSASVKNYGSEIISFDVLIEIDDDGTLVFESTKSVTDLAFGEVAIVDFDAWTAVDGLNYTATVTTLLSGDENPLNDQKAHQFVVYSANSYCIPSADCTWDDGFIDFAFAGIENYESGCSVDGYGVFLDMEATVEIGYTYTATMAAGYVDDFASMWIDFNQDLEFSEDERILTDFPMGDAGVLTEVDIVIPGSGLPGTTRMRIGANWIDPSSPNPCATLLYGEWEDYTIIVTGNSITSNAGVASIDMLAAFEQGDITPKATVKNYGDESISFPVTCTIDGGYTSTLNVTDLAADEEISLDFDIWPATPGVYTMEVVTDLAGDEFPANDTLNASLEIVEWAPPKMIIGEEATGTWCGWCVRGAVYLDSMAMKYPETWIGIAVHNYDPMVVAEYDAGIGQLISGYPSGLVNRANDIDPQEFEVAYLQEMEIMAPASIVVENKTFNSSTGELTFTITSEFIAEATDFRFNAVIVENGVTGTGDGWAQANAYAGGGSGPMGGYENLPNPVPAEDMVYEHVARAILGGFEGAEGSLPAIVNPGEIHSYEFTTTVSADWDINKLEVVGMLIDQTTGRIENATVDHLITSVTNLEASNKVAVYPNPAQGQLTLSNVEQSNIYIYNINGQLMMEKQNVSNVCKLDISKLVNGTYIVKIISINETITKKVNIIK